MARSEQIVDDLAATDRRRLVLPAVLCSIVYIGLLLIVPARLAVPSIGAPGTPANLWGIACLAIWLVMTATGWNRQPISPVRVTTGIFAICALISYIAGHVVGWYQPADIQQSLGQGRLWQLVSMDQLVAAMSSAGDRGLLALAGWLGILLITSEGIRSWDDLELLTTWVVRFAMVVSILGMVQYFTGLNVASYIRIPGLAPLSELVTFERAQLNRVVSTAQHPIELGVVMAAILPLALHRSLHNHQRWSWIPTALIGVTVLTSVSRSAIIVAAGTVFILFLGWPGRWRILALAALPFVAVAARVAFPGLLGTIRSLFVHFNDDPSIDGRTDDYDLVLRTFYENPVWGRGLFTWVPAYFRTLDNQILVTLLEIGAVGLLSFLALVGAGVLCGIYARRHAIEFRHAHLGMAISAGLVGIILSYLTFDALGFRQAAGTTFLLIGMAGAAWRMTRLDRVAESNGSATAVGRVLDPGARTRTPKG